MRRSLRKALPLLALLLPLATLGVVPASPAAGARNVTVVITNPSTGQPVFGETELRAQVQAPAGARIQKVEFYLDGLLVGTVSTPPYRLLVDAGQDNVEHNIEAVAYDATGATSTARVRTAVIQSDMQVDVALRQLFINVDRGGEPVLDLPQSVFEVYDDGERQNIVTFARGDIPFTAVIAVDASGSMTGSRLRTAVDGARSFAQAMQRLDECKLVLFADRVLTETPFTSTPTILTLGLENVRARGGTALNDSVYLALKRLEPRTGRKVVIVLSDGVDMESVLSMERAQALARQDSVVLYWLQPQDEGYELPVSFASWWRNEDNHQRELNLLRRTILDSGGRIDVLRDINQVPAALGRVLKDLREQYVIGYYPSKTRGTGTWHDIEVRVKGSGLRARTQRGYVEK